MNDGGQCESECCYGCVPELLFLSYTTTGTWNCAVNVRSVDLDNCKISFGGKSVLHLDGSDLSTSYNVQAASYRKHENHLVFYFYSIFVIQY